MILNINVAEAIQRIYNIVWLFQVNILIEIFSFLLE